MKKKTAALAGLALMAGGTAVVDSAGATANASIASQRMTCTARKFVYANSVIPGAIEVDFSATVRGKVSSDNKRAVFNRIDWSFTNARFIPTAGVPSSIGATVGGHSNVNRKAPGSWYSADNLGQSGTIYVPAFSVANGGQVQIQGVPDIANLPDPSCTAYTTVSWK